MSAEWVVERLHGQYGKARSQTELLDRQGGYAQPVPSRYKQGLHSKRSRAPPTANDVLSG
jgi:hypothetical protein